MRTIVQRSVDQDTVAHQEDSEVSLAHLFPKSGLHPAILCILQEFVYHRPTVVNASSSSCFKRLLSNVETYWGGQSVNGNYG